MKPGDAQLLFMTDLTSPWLILALVVLLVMVGLITVSLVASSGWKKGIVFAALRLGSAIVLGMVLMQPAWVTFESREFSLPREWSHKTVSILPESFVRRLLPPWFRQHEPPERFEADVEVQAVSVPPSAFLKGECPVSVTVANHGRRQEGELVVSRLTEEGASVKFRQKMTLQAGRQEVRLAIVPEDVGRLAYSVALEGFPEDPNADNDVRVFGLTVVRDSLSILHIAGHPSWDVRFLREFLVGLPAAELVSFYLLLQAEDFAPHSGEELALIPFPTDELFLEEVGNFDVIIFQNFPLGTYFLLKDTHRQMLVRFVEQGGALLFLGGDEAYQLGKVEETALLDLLPVDLVQGEDAPYVAAPLGVEAPSEAVNHPVVDIQGADGSRPLEEGGLPLLLGANNVGSLTREGVGLLFAHDASSRYPLLAVRNYGKGRVLLVATDSLWRWAFPPDNSEAAREVYRQLMWNSLAWLSRDPRLDEARILSESSLDQAGTETLVRTCIQSDAVEPDKVVLDARWMSAVGKAGSMVVQARPESREGRCLKFRLPPARVGAWMVKALVEGVDSPLGSAVLALNPVGTSGPQWVREAIAPVLRNPPVPLDLDSRLGFDLENPSMAILVPHLEPLGFHPLWLAVLSLLLLSEWLLRRAWGYL